jgi:hypothetical protein
MLKSQCAHDLGRAWGGGGDLGKSTTRSHDMTRRAFLCVWVKICILLTKLTLAHYTRNMAMDLWRKLVSVEYL